MTNTPQEKDTELPPEDDPLEAENTEDDDDEWSCSFCRGPMYSQPHWKYGQCDDCGRREALISDEP